MLDLLDALPNDIFDLNIWCSLPDEARAALRLTCQPTLRHADQLLSTATFYLNNPHASNDDAEMDDDAAWEQWERDAERRFAFLARLPTLTAMHLRDWARETDVMRWLLRCGAASGGRVTTLSLDGDGLSMAGGMAVNACCPRLRQLNLGCHDYGQEADAMVLMRDAFLNLRQSPMTSLKLGFGCDLLDFTMPSLGGLTNLRSLTIDTDITPYQLDWLTGLVSLEHCAITSCADGDDNELSFVTVAVLFSLTRLTHLGTAPLRDFSADGAGPSSVANDNWRDANAQLAGLSRLQSLDLGKHFRVDDALLEALGPLPQLTALTAGGLGVLGLLRGHLPRLRALRFSGVQRPTELLLSLQPLLPLAQLVELGRCELDVSCYQGAEYAAAQTAALAEVARLLAAAPQLRLPHLSFSHFGRDAEDGQHLRVRALADALQPLASRLLQVSFEGMDLEGGHWGEGVPWALVDRLLPNLEHLGLTMCTLGDAGLVAIAVRLPRLRALSMRGCTGVTDGGWPLLCAARTAPLQLYVSPRLSDYVAEECAEVEECAVVWL